MAAERAHGTDDNAALTLSACRACSLVHPRCSNAFDVRYQFSHFHNLNDIDGGSDSSSSCSCFHLYLCRTTAAKNHLLPERKSLQTTIPHSPSKTIAVCFSPLFAEPRRFWVARCSASLWNNLLINKKCKRLEVNYRPSSFVSIETFSSRMMCSSSYPPGKKTESLSNSKRKKNLFACTKHSLT